MEKERDFYFGKLRNIELICQEKDGEDDPTLSRIIQILYATDVSPGLPTHWALLRCYYTVVTGAVWFAVPLGAPEMRGPRLSTFLRRKVVSNLLSRLDI